MVRLWWNSSEKRVFNIVDRFTSKYVSSVLSFQEISSVQTSTQLFNGMTVSIILNFFLEKFFVYYLTCEEVKLGALPFSIPSKDRAQKLADTIAGVCKPFL